ncbi:addiction module toxin RelE [Cohnella sp. CIP 111063]|jgi:toxin ParE1/3/4|uniref:type II toxin-antitoxin system RelE/ParE family toxin n=1 Tax=unclassified Cohnella TaxID=2636738 RepID=UPI000B8C2153|nr:MULTISPECIES: type II toxin-antitoxin system RelE/ParE family toxin [unclassified Cohnella]OXS54445.1 addiction module toxin RelE [Cohnella sp. CIP 111063]PRX63942.1 plasmid stabilization system protein ParE [Cohnella sp. SGD-V74]
MEKKLPIKYLPSASQDITDIIEYISVDNPPAALNLLNLFDEKISTLAYFPHSGPIPNDKRLQLLNYRMLVVDNYLVFYVVYLEFIEIRRVLHGKRKYGFLL